MENYEGYKIVSAKGNDSRFKEIKPDGKGSIPVVLLGLYTNSAAAMKAIDTYRSQHKAKVKANATKQSNG